MTGCSPRPPATPRWPWGPPRSIQAEATARVIADAAPGRVYDLTGPDVIGWAELAELAGVAGVAGVEYRPESDDDYRARYVGLGWPEAVVGQLLALCSSIRSGWGGPPTGDLAALLGRPPVSVRRAVEAVVRAQEGENPGSGR